LRCHKVHGDSLKKENISRNLFMIYKQRNNQDWTIKFIKRAYEDNLCHPSTVLSDKRKKVEGTVLAKIATVSFL
jgi:hypothetical protein